APDHLDADDLVTPADPGTAGLQVQYQFEGNANDSSGKGRNGSLKGAPMFVAGKAGQAISLNGTADYVNIDGYKGILADAAGVQQPLTLTAWIKTATNGRDIIAWGTNAGGQRMNFRVDTVLRVEHGGGNIRGTNGPSLIDNEWHHVAATVPQGGRIMDVLLYVDGMNVTPPSTTTAAFNLQPDIDVVIGQGGTQGSRFFLGLIDEVRIYDRVLSAGEIAWLAGQTMPFDKPF
ncbi:MAG TPA: LamG domain-containing protein, partial [Sedimentisphaerales bacterium]|nr:LamG domain-containing protein [Sedimentisphaerales bacterium]